MTRIEKLVAGLALSLLLVAGLSVQTQSAYATHSYQDVSNNWEISAPGANTDAITDITWTSTDAARITIQVDTSTVVNVMVTRGATENALGLNSNTALTAGALYTFDVYGLDVDDTLNVQVETDSAIPQLAIGRVKKD